jgi:hypothetical protein
VNGIAWIREAFATYCVTFARGLSIHELVRRLGTDPARILPSVSAHETALLARDKGPVARLGTANGWAFALESAGMLLPDGSARRFT